LWKLELGQVANEKMGLTWANTGQRSLTRLSSGSAIAFRRQRYNYRPHWSCLEGCRGAN
jgi:hypothetical protein